MKKFKSKLEFKKTVISDFGQSQIKGGNISNGCSSFACGFVWVTKQIDVPTWGDPGCPGTGMGI